MPAELASGSSLATAADRTSRLSGCFQLDWASCRPLIAFLLLEHLTLILALNLWGLPYQLPGDVVTLLPLFAFGGPLFGAFMLIVPLGSDFRDQCCGRPVPALRERLIDAGRIGVCVGLMGIAFYVHMLASANLKPAYFTIRGLWFDHALEATERALFAGVLPTEWFVSVHSPAGMTFWQYVYDTFSVYLFLTVALAAHFEGLRGAVRYTLSLCMGHAATLVIALVWPTMGPVFVHREWFSHLPQDLPTLIFSAQLLQTVDNYTHFRSLTHTVCGISAMPSYHVLAWTCGVYVWSRAGHGATVLVAAFVGANWLATVILGWHYALDGLVGIALAIVCWRLAHRLCKNFPASTSYKLNS